MLYAKVVLGLPVEGPFDYAIPLSLEPQVKIGQRVIVSFGPQRKIAYVVGITSKTRIQNVKEISESLDDNPVLDRWMLGLARELSAYYCCSWGEVIEALVPSALREGKRVPVLAKGTKVRARAGYSATLLHDLGSNARWGYYFNYLKNALSDNKSSVLVFPDINLALVAGDKIKKELGITPAVLCRQEKGELEEWLKVKNGGVKIAVGTRAAVFAPFGDLGLLIIDEEQDTVYKQEQVPHYHAREAAFMRCRAQGARLVLASSAPSLETFYLARKKKIGYSLIPREKSFPQIKITDAVYQGKSFILKYLTDALMNTLNAEGKALLFLNRKGFATLASCHNCGKPLVCPRCNINLVYHFKEKILNCRYCNFRMPAPDICPNCKSGYIKYSGSGIEKIESELSRIFPGARVQILAKAEDIDLANSDIFISTSFILKTTGCHFDLVGVLGIDNALNRIDFRAAEKTFQLLEGLSLLTDKMLVIQTRLLRHHVFEALAKNNPDIFYEAELKQRKQLGFAPYRHMALVRLRGKFKLKVKNAAVSLFERLRSEVTDQGIKVLSVSPGQPAKLRGNFYWQILLSAGKAERISNFLKNRLKKFRHSGIIVTVDIDPV